MNQLFPPIEPFKTEFLKVSDIHTLYLEQSGNPNGKPIILLHGGPGSKTKPEYRQFFDPEKYQIIMFDQRGCGKSTPVGELEENTTPDLVEDIEKIRKYLGIDSWIVFGGSWGSALALAYSQTHPEPTKGLIIRGITTFTQKEIEWIMGKGPDKIFPDYFRDFISIVPEEKRSSILQFFYDEVMCEDKERAYKAVSAFQTWETALLNLIPKFDDVGEPEEKLAGTRIFFHYAVNRGFFTEDQLLQNAHILEKIPTVIIHGRYDMICPLQVAWNLHEKLPNAEFHIIPDAGHHSTEPGNTDKLIEYSNKFSSL